MLPVPHRHNALLQPGGALVLFLKQLVACFWLVESLLLAIDAKGCVSGADLSALLEARDFLLLVIHVTG